MADVVASRITIPVETNAASAANDAGKLDATLLKLDKSLGSMADSMQKAQKNTEKVAGVLKVLEAVIPIAAISSGLHQIVSSTADAQYATAQLNAVLTSTGGIVGMTTEEMKGLAESLRDVSIYDDDAIVRSEALLLTFTKIGKTVFPQAEQSILDMASAMGQDLQSATIMVGKALNDPIQGITALQRVGVQLSAQQKQQIKDFVAVGDVAKAQGVILGELQTQFGGTAAAMSQTLGGGLKQVGFAFDDLLKAAGTEATQGILDLGSAFVTAAKDGGVLYQTFEGLGKLIGVIATGLGYIVSGLNMVFNEAAKAQNKPMLESLTKQAFEARAEIEKMYNAVTPKEKANVMTLLAKDAQVAGSKAAELKKKFDTLFAVRRELANADQGYASSSQASYNKMIEMADTEGRESAKLAQQRTQERNKEINAIKQKAAIQSQMQAQYVADFVSGQEVMAKAGDLRSQLGVLALNYNEQRKLAQKAGMDMTVLTQFNEQQRLSIMDGYMKQQTAMAGTEDEARAVALQNAYNKILATETLGEQERLKLKQLYNVQQMALDKQRMQSQLESIALAQTMASDTLSIFSNMSAVRTNLDQQEIESMKAKGATAEEIQKKEKQLARKRAKDQRTYAIFGIILDTAVAVAKALASSPPPLSYVLAGLSAAKGASQLAVAVSTPIPAAQFGGDFMVPPGYAADSGLLRVNQGERVSVQPVRQTDNAQNNNSGTTVLQIGDDSMDAWLTKKLNQHLNSGAVQIRRAGTVKIAR